MYINDVSISKICVTKKSEAKVKGQKQQNLLLRLIDDKEVFFVNSRNNVVLRFRN